MSRICWASDLHLDVASDCRRRQAFYDEVIAACPEHLVISGDIANGPTIENSLRELRDSLPCRISFVLGNHDFYGRSIEDVRKNVRTLVEESPGLTYLSAVEAVPLSQETCVIGHDGWADGRAGNYARSTVVLNDYVNIRDFVPLGKWPRLALMQALGDAGAEHLRQVLEPACARYRRIVIVTHIPPFPQACLYHGDRSDTDYLPHYCCRATGDVLAETAVRWPDREFVVLCGHTHEAIEVAIADNLTVHVAAAKYGRPQLAGEVWV